MRRSRLAFGCLTPDQGTAFLPFPNDGDGEPPAAAGALAPPAPPSGSDEFPAETPWAQMSVEQQAAYWRTQAKKHEERARKTDALAAWKKENEAKVADYDRLLEASKTEHERALDAVKAETAESVRREVRGQMIRELVDAEFRAAARGALTKDQVSKLLAPLDPNYFVADNGGVDVDKISTYVAELSPAPAAGNGAGKASWPDTGQGRRGAHSGSASVQAGAELYQRMKNPQTNP